MIKVTLNLCKKYHFRKKEVLLDEQSVNALIDEKSSYMDEESGIIYDHICRMPEKYRTVIVLYYFEELNGREIARYLGITETSVRKRLSRGREWLKKELEGMR